MALTTDFFRSVEHLEPKCPGCKVKIEYGVNTRFDDKEDTHVCLKCGAKIE